MAYADPSTMLASAATAGGTIDYTNPDWYNQYLQNVAGTANTLTGGASQPGSIAYNTNNWYSQPLTGDWNSNLNSAYTGAAAAGQPGGYLSQAMTDLGTAQGIVGSGVNTMGTGVNTIGTGVNTMGTGVNTIGTGVNTMGTGVNTIGTGVNTMETGADTIAGNIPGISNVVGGLNQVSNTIPGMTNYTTGQGGLSMFMNPYTTDAANATTNLVNKNLFENVLPQVNSTFTGAGQFGGTRNADFENRAIRDTNQALSNTIGNLNYGATKDAQTAYQNWINSLLTGAQTQGQLGATALQGLNDITNAGTDIGNIGANIAQAGTGVGNIGANIAQAGSGIGNIGSNMSWAGQNEANIANTLANVGNSDIQNLATAGKSYLDWQNSGLGATYADYLKQLAYPTDALGALSQMTSTLRGSTNPSMSVTPGEMTAAQKAALLTSMAGTLGQGSTLQDISALWDSIFGTNTSSTLT